MTISYEQLICLARFSEAMALKTSSDHFPMYCRTWLMPGAIPIISAMLVDSSMSLHSVGEQKMPLGLLITPSSSTLMMGIV